MQKGRLWKLSSVDGPGFEVHPLFVYYRDMEFGSMSFLWIFLPLAITTYYAARFLSHEKERILNAALFALSSAFYIYGGG